ncbi:MAG: DUF364 domain-containing protein [Candidatus Pelethousia sp.]|nr:DUF364 domain-containing protein [Candidatus Pelethousia sp.]
MNMKDLYDTIVARFLAVPGINDELSENVTIRARALTPQEAIGVTERKDYPILTGNDVMIEAEYKGSFGQAFTDAPASYSGTLRNILALPFDTDAHARGLLIAAINAVLGHMGLCDRIVHCRNDGPKRCGKDVADHVTEQYGDPRLLLVGYQPSMLENLSARISYMRVLDLNPNNISQTRCGIVVEDGIKDREAAIDWAELILCTGSTVCNGTLGDYLDTGKATLFYGTTLAGAAALLQLPRLCFADRYL